MVSVFVALHVYDVLSVFFCKRLELLLCLAALLLLSLVGSGIWQSAWHLLLAAFDCSLGCGDVSFCVVHVVLRLCDDCCVCVSPVILLKKS